MQLLVEAVGRVLARQGFQAVKVNVVAREAGVDKVLIYRYFGGLPGLVAAFANSGDFWPDARELAGGDIEAFLALPYAERLTIGVCNYLRAIRHRPLTQEILAWRFMVRNELTDAIDSVRETVGTRLLSLLHPDEIAAAELDMQALFAILGGVINHLGVRARFEENYAGFPLDDEKSWERLEAMLARIIRSVVPAS